jgi:RNA polymerase sigma factor for flagellar operon FliA
MTEPTPDPDDTGEGFRTTTAPDNRAHVNGARGNIALGIPTPSAPTMDDRPRRTRGHDGATSTTHDNTPGLKVNGATPAHANGAPTDDRDQHINGAVPDDRDLHAHSAAADGLDLHVNGAAADGHDSHVNGAAADDRDLPDNAATSRNGAGPAVSAIGLPDSGSTNAAITNHVDVARRNGDGPRDGVVGAPRNGGVPGGDGGGAKDSAATNGLHGPRTASNGVRGGDVASTFVGRAGHVLGGGAAVVTNGTGVSFGFGETAGVLPGDQRTFDDVEAGIVALWRQYGERREQRLRDRLVLHYAPLVKYVAGRVGTGLPAHVEVADLIQSGIFGLVDAIEKFEPERGLKFETYAMQRIRGAILDDLRAQDWVPRSVRGRAREVERALERLGAKLRRTPTDAELADELGLSLHELREVYAQLQLTSVVALDELAAAGRGSTPLADILEDQEALDPVALLVDQDNRRQLAQAIAHLAERDRVVVTLYYFENLTLAEIGRVLGVTESRVCQLHTRAVLRLRAKLLEKTEV